MATLSHKMLVRFFKNDGTPLDDDKTVSYYGIRDKDVLHFVDLMKIDIIIQTIDGRNVIVQVRKNDRIADVITRIEHQIRFVRNEHKLQYMGIVMDNYEARLCDYGILNESLIQIIDQTKNDIEPTVKNLEPSEQEKYGFYNDSNWKIVDKLKMNIIIDTIDERNVAIEVRSNDRIMDLMAKIEQKIRFLHNEHQLKFYDKELNIYDARLSDYGIKNKSHIQIIKRLKKNDFGINHIKLLHNNNTLDYYNIESNRKLKLVDDFPNELKIFVRTCEEKTYVFYITKGSRIFDIKKTISERVRITEDSIIMIKGSQILKDGGKTTDDYNITNNTFIEVISRAQYIIKLEIHIFKRYLKHDYKYTLDVLNDDLIYDVKAKLQEKLGGLSISHHLFSKGVELEDNKTIESYVISKRRTDRLIILEVFGYEVSTCCNFFILNRREINKMNQINDWKIKLQPKIRCALGDVIFLYNGHFLEDNDKTIGYNNIDKVEVYTSLRTNMRLFVVAFGDWIPVVTEKYGSLKTVKSKICENLRLVSDDHSLMYKEHILEEEKTPLDYDIVENSVIRLNRKFRSNMGIYVTLSDGKIINIAAHNNDTIIDLKKKINKKYISLPINYSLTYKGQVLEDFKTIEDYNIKDDYRIDMLARYGKYIRINVVSRNDEIFKLDVMSDDSMDTVKTKISKVIWLSPNDQTLFYGGVRFEDNQTLADYNINENSLIKVESKFKCDIKIFVDILHEPRIKFDKKNDKIHVFINNKLNDSPLVENLPQFVVNNSEIIMGLKKRICDFFKLPDYEIVLFYMGTILEEDRMVGDYMITENSIVSVVRGKRFLRPEIMLPNDESVAIDVMYDDTIYYLKNIIQEITGYPMEKISLLLQGELFDKVEVNTNIETIGGSDNIEMKVDDEREIFKKSHCSFGSDNIEKRIDEEIAIFEKRFNIFVMTLQREMFKLVISRTFKIIDIKRMLIKRLNHHIEFQQLVFGGIVLEDNKTVEYYGFDSNDVILLIANLPGGVKLQANIFNRIIAFEATIESTINAIKFEIEERTGIIPRAQILGFRGGILKDENTIGYYRINEDSIITVLTELESMTISIRRLEGTLIRLDIFTIDKVRDIKIRISDEATILPDEQILKLNREILRDDTMTVYQCGITEKSNLEVSKAIKKYITISSDFMETVELEVFESDRMIDIERKYYQKTGLTANELNPERDVIPVPFSTPVTPSARVYCVIISNELFVNNTFPPRTGTQIDEEILKRTFENIGFEVKIYQNVSSTDMASLINETKDIVRDIHKLLILFVLSYGNNDEVVTFDGVKNPIRNIYAPFSNFHFPEFKGNSKLFFFVVSGDSKGTTGVMGDVLSHNQDMSDFLICNTASMLHESMINPENGTMYVQVFCDVVQRHREWSMNDIRAEVDNILETKNVQLPFYITKISKYSKLLPNQ